MRKSPAGQLWQFALAVYGQPPVSECCLQLQDEAGVDVNLLLAAAYSGAIGQRWELATLARLLDASTPLREAFILPLRGLRRAAAEPAPPAVYESLKNAELAAERWQLDRLEAILGASAGTGAEGALAHNIALLGAHYASGLNAAGQAALAEGLGQFSEILAEVTINADNNG